MNNEYHRDRASRLSGNGTHRTPFRINPPCIDLEEHFGQKYRIEYEESYYAQYGPKARVNDPWLKIIPCANGHVCPWGGSTLAAVRTKAGPIDGKLADVPGVTLWQDGEKDGSTFLFDVAIFDQVATLMDPRSRRRLSEAQRKKCAENLTKAREKKRAPEAPRDLDSDASDAD